MPETNPVFKAVITAVDNATAVLDRIGAKIAGIGAKAELAGNPWGPATEKVSRFHQAMEAAARVGERMESIVRPFEHVKHPLHEVGESVHELKEHFGELTEKVTEILPALGALGAGATLAGMFELTNHVAEAAGEFQHVATEIGATTGELAKLIYIAKMTDTPVEAMENGMGKLSRAIGSASAGKNKDVAALFAHLHIGLRDSNGQILRAVDALPQLQEAYSKTTDVTLRQRAAFALFGRAGLEMLPLLLASREEMDKWGKRAKELSVPFTKEDAEHLEEYHHAMIDMDKATSGVGRALGARLAPILTPVIEKVTDFIIELRPEVVDGFAGKIEKLADWVMKLDFDKAVSSTKAWITPVTDVVGKFVSLKGVIYGTAAGMAVPWLSAAFNVVASLTAMASAAIKAAWAIGSGLVTSLDAADAAMQRFNATSARNPLLRTAMLASEAWDRARQGNLLTQQELDGNPGEARRLGYEKDQAGKWTFDGHPAPDASGTGDTGSKPDWFQRNTGIGDRLWRWFGGADDGQKNQTDAPMFGPWGGFGEGATAAASPTPSSFEQLRSMMNAGSERGRVDVNVQFDNVPPGMTVTTTGSGAVGRTQGDVGYAFPELMPAFAH